MKNNTENTEDIFFGQFSICHMKISANFVMVNNAVRIHN